MQEQNFRNSQPPSISEEELIKYLKNQGIYYEYRKMDEAWQKDFINFCTGLKSLPLLYDTTFKRIFDPIVHRDRLSDLISCILGQSVTVKEVYPAEDSFIDGGKIVIMDIIVELEDGSIADVEIQKSPYTFAGERISCFSSDLMLRQYSKVKGVRKNKFSYTDLRKVYTIIIYEKTEHPFHGFDSTYLHHGSFTFDSGLTLNMLQNTYLVALDQFRKIAYHRETSRLSGWLSLLITEDIKDVIRVSEEYPWLKPIYQEISEYRNNPQEVFDMYSSMIAELDRNSLQYLVDEQQEEINNQKATINSQNETISHQDKTIITLNETVDSQALKIKELTERIKQLEKQN